MQSFEAFVKALTACSSGLPSEEQAADVLLLDWDWNSVVRRQLDSLGAERFIGMFGRVRYPRVQPSAILLYEEPGCFQVIAHHFDRQLFDEYWRQERPNAHRAHRHHLGFASRILSGHYFTWQYENVGSREVIELTVQERAKCESGDVHWLGPERFHSVLAPVNDTVTLVVRCGINPCHAESHDFVPQSALDLRTRVLDILSSASTHPGRLLPKLCGR